MTFEPRDLEITDYDKGNSASLCGLLKEIASMLTIFNSTLLAAGFLQLLGQLTFVGDVSREAFNGEVLSISADLRETVLDLEN